MSKSSGIDCVSKRDCPGDHVCFLGTCFPAGGGITEVYVDVWPSDGSMYAPQPGFRVAQKVGEELGVADELVIYLTANETLSGTVRTTNRGEARSGTLRADPVLIGPLESNQPVQLPSTRLSVTTVVTEGSFDLRLLPGDYGLTFIPEQTVFEPDDGPWTSNKLDELRRAMPPPYQWYDARNPLPTNAVGSDGLSLSYPDTDELFVVTGVVAAPVAPTSSTPIEGARVFGEYALTNGAHDPHLAPLRSSEAITWAGGTYALVFPFGANRFSLTVGPSDVNPYVPRQKKDFQAELDHDAVFAELEEFQVSKHVPGELVAEVAGPDGTKVRKATLLFQGDTGEGSFSANTMVDADGSARAQLLPGSYDITVVPDTSEPFALTSQKVCFWLSRDEAKPEVCRELEITASVDITLRAKVTVSGQVVDWEENPVPNARVSFRLTEGPTLRNFSTETGPNGEYSLSVDPPEQDKLLYEIVVDPTPVGDRPLPRHREHFELSEARAQTHRIRFNKATLVYGRVLDHRGLPVRDARVSFFTTKTLASPENPLLVSVGQSNDTGEFVVALPVPTEQ